MEPIIEFENFTFKYRSQMEPTLRDINLKIYPGEKVLIIGPSGSGKSTLSNCINGLIPFSYEGDSTGTLKIEGKDPKNLGIFGLSKMVGTVLQDTDGQFIGLTVPVSYGQAAGAELTISGFTATYGNWVSIFTAVAMCCFAFSTIIGWGLYGTRCIEFLFGSRVNKPFMLVYALVAIVGATMDLGLMWSIAETFNGLMAIPNLIAVFLLSGVVVKLVKEYFAGEGAKS